MTSPNRSQGPKRPGLSVAVASEAVKLLTLPRLRFLALVVVVLGTATALLFYLTLPVTQGRTLAELAPSEVLSVGLLGIDAAALVLIVFAALVVGDEYTTGMMQTTLTLTPARDRVLGAKLVVVGLTALAVGVVTAGCCLGIGLSFGASAGFAPAELLAAGAWQRAAGGVAMPVCYAVLSACGAAVFRGTGPGIVTALAVLGLGGLVALIGGGASAAITPVLPVAAIHSLAGNAAGPEAIGVLGGMLSLALWLVAASLLARWRLVRHDA